MNWRDFAQLAVYLDQNADASRVPEAARRSAVSRMYYAAFCFVRDYAQAHLNFKPQRKSADHTGLRRHLRDKSLRDLAINLDHLQGWREACDYQSTVENLDKICQNATTEMQEIFDCIDRRGGI